MTQFADSRTLIIFDVDGTLVDAHPLDNGCFDRAFQEEVGMALPEDMWSQFEELTGQSVIHQALGKAWPDLAGTEMRVKNSFLEKLRRGVEADGKAIRAYPGAIEFLYALRKNPVFGVAIATGCWRETAHFKLTSAGFDFADIPFACTSDRYSRAEIITLAAERAGWPVERAIYVGDGLWDLRATRQLGIPFIGVGRRIEALRKAGAKHTLEVFEPDAFARVIQEIRAARN